MKTPMKKIALLIIMLNLPPFTKAGDIIPEPMLLFVGDGGGQCTYTSIQDAVDDASVFSEIRVTTENGTLFENIIVDKSLTLKGGYTSCGLAQSDTRIDANRTILDGGESSAVMIVTGDDIQFDMSGFQLQNGTNIFIIPSGGMTLAGNNSEFNLTNLIIKNNVGILGGGVYFSGDSTLNLQDTKIFTNDATSGGGLYCGESGRVNFLVGSGTYVNSAVDGGGIYANSCSIYLQNGEVHQNSFSVLGVSSNFAQNSGGGIYLTDSQLSFRPDSLNDNYSPTNIDHNVANTDGDENGDGGGIYAINSEVFLDYSYIYQNTVLDGNGGAIWLNNSSIKSDSTYACLSRGFKCVWFEKNQAIDDALSGNTIGGAIYATNNSQIGNIDVGSPFKAYFVDNRADQASAISLTSGSTALIQNSYFIDNGENSAGITNDTSVMRVNGASTEAHISFSTFADNDSSTVFDIENSGTVDLLTSIVNESSNQNTVVNPGSDFNFGCSIFHEGDSVGFIPPLNQTVINQTPGFVDAANNDYHINFNSIAVDKCSTAGIGDTVGVDRDGDNRGINISGISNGNGPFDAGADEYVDLIFENDFEDISPPTL